MLADSGVKVFQIETTLNSETFPSNLGFLNKREWEWSASDQGLMMAAKKANDLAPPRIRREFFQRIEAPYKLTGVNAGEVEAVHERTMTNLHRQQLVEVNGQADVLILGLPYLGPYNVNSILNPILVHCLGLGYLFNMYRNKPLVREGGVGDPAPPGAVGVQPDPPPQLHRLLRRGAARDHRPEGDRGDLRGAVRPPTPGTAHLYRTSHAYHGVHPFYMWYWGAHGRDHAGDVIFVGGNPSSVSRLGYRRADSMRDRSRWRRTPWARRRR